MSTSEFISRPLTLEEYLRVEDGSVRRHEFIAGQMYLVPDASRRHSFIVGKLMARFHQLAQLGGCEVYANMVKLRTADDIVYYPDVMVTCDPDDNDPYIVTRPSLVIEVLSPSTAAVDQREKSMVYRQIESLQTYLVMDQDKRWVMHHGRDETGAWWRGELTRGEDRIPSRCLGMEVTLDQIYQGIL